MKKGKLLFICIMIMIFTVSCNEPAFDVVTETGETLQEQADTALNSLEEEEVCSPPAKIYVYMCGAVEHPGVCCLSEGSRVYEAVEAAGGFTEDASRVSVNLAENIRDGQQVYIPTKAEAESSGVSLWTGSKQADSADSTENAKVNINTATVEELTVLPGIGPSKAEKIIHYREINGLFSSVEQLTDIPGIKSATYDQIKDLVTID